jgi:hypothetical protein
MDREHPSPPEGEPLQFSSHLLPALLAAAKLGVELACDGEWDVDVHLEPVCDAVLALVALKGGTYTREQLASLANLAATMQGDAMQSAAEAESDAESFPVAIGEAWPKTADAVDALQAHASLTRDLLSLRDEARSGA